MGKGSHSIALQMFSNLKIVSSLSLLQPGRLPHRVAHFLPCIFLKSPFKCWSSSIIMSQPLFGPFTATVTTNKYQPGTKLIEKLYLAGTHQSGTYQESHLYIFCTYISLPVKYPSEQTDLVLFNMGHIQSARQKGLWGEGIFHLVILSLA